MIAGPPAISPDPTAHVETHRIDDRFVPVRVGDLVAVLRERAALAGIAAADVSTFAAELVAIVDQETAGFQRHISDEYSVFNPDRDTLPLEDDSHKRRPEDFARLSARLDYLLDKANFHRLDSASIEIALKMASAHGLRVRLDPNRIDTFAIYVRGQGHVPLTVRTVRDWRHWRHGAVVQVPVYRRLVVVARLRDDPHVLLKMFKDIPEADIEALLPHAEVAMTWRDRLMMLSGSAGAVGSTAAKIFSTAVLVVSRLMWIVLMGGVVVAWRSFNGYRRARISRDWQRTRHLYYQNLSNNVGVIATLIFMIAQEEVKEALLAYMVCLLDENPIRDTDDLRERVENVLKDQLNVVVNFDIDDAMESVDRLELWLDRASFRVLPLNQAIAQLRKHHAGQVPRDYHRLAAAGRMGALT